MSQKKRAQKKSRRKRSDDATTSDGRHVSRRVLMERIGVVVSNQGRFTPPPTTPGYPPSYPPPLPRPPLRRPTLLPVLAEGLGRVEKKRPLNGKKKYDLKKKLGKTR